MRYSVAVILAWALAACADAPNLLTNEAGSLSESAVSLKIAVRGLGEVTHTADLAGLAACSTLPPNPERADCVRNYAPSASVVLQSKAAPGYRFDHWSGKCTGTGTCALTMNEPRVLEAIFKLEPAPPPLILELLVAVRGRGEVTHTADRSGATNCNTLPPKPESANCALSFNRNTAVMLTAQAAPDFRFDHWGGPCTGTGSCTVTMNERRALEVIFKATSSPPPSSYTLGILVRGRGSVVHSSDLDGSGACTVQPPATVTECVRRYAPGSEISLAPQAATGARFVGWSGACGAAGAGACTLKANENRVIEAKFEG